MSFQIFGIVLGDAIGNSFPVDIIEDMTVGHLKDIIKKKKEPHFNHISADELKLWSVNFPTKGEDLETKIYAENIKEQYQGVMLSPFKTVGKYFHESTSNIQIIVQPPVTTARNLPETLEYRDPQPLLKGSGSSWDFQASEALKQKLKNAIRDHFKFWKAGQREKTTIPQYFILAGAGEGKSRTAQELPKLLIECTNDDVDLQNRLRSDLVFNLSLENGTILLRKVENNSSYAIGNRMLFQLLQQPEQYQGVMLSPFKTVGKYFHESTSNIQIIVQPPVTTARNLPETLEYRDPQPLLKGSGSSWDFQASEALKQKLKNAIRDHFKFWKAGQREKTTIPQYFILAGAGEGKSRTAQELPKLLIECTNDDVDLQNRLRSDLVFNLSLENGTILLRKVENNSSYAIGNRMLFQLLQQPGESWDNYMDRYNVNPADVLRRVAKHRNQELNDLNVIVILDGIQVAMKKAMDGTDKRFFFYNCISTLCMLSLLGPFIITCCTATISIPIHNFLASSQQLRVFLPLTSLQPPRINRNPVFVDNPIMKMLINDMGGHGRALEALEESISGKDLDNINFIDLINDVRSNLNNKYQGWLSKTTYLKPVLRIILSHARVDKNQNIATFEGKEITVNDITQFGLVRFESRRTDEVVGYLTCPYIWLWIMARASLDDKLLRNWDFNYYNEVRNKAGDPSIPPGCQYWQNFEYFVAQFRSLKSNIYGDNEQVELGSRRTDEVVGYLTCPYIWLWIMARASLDDKLLRNWDFNYYNEVRNKAGDPSIPPGCQYWQNFEYFVAQFRSLKSNIYGDNEQVELGVIHNGAKHNFGDSSIYNRKLTLEQSVKRVSTKSGDYKQGTELLQTETHQCKLVKQIISQERFKYEHEKAMNPGDAFILYTSTSSKKLELHQPMSAIVSKDNWEEYFGSFAGRCYNYAMEPPNLNEATYTQLTGINFIAEARARIIMEERNKCKFSGIDDCERRTKIPRTYLEPFF
ncbi:hypothetical protein Glove_15g40 [Diversispora epigaea]|uniref:Crinkler effector protein N-terminal domain-containing protein n=1 Tax=Diversispora epigaea TaxID=1348612 RepID=A0A397JN90_9GLOM|nr:hypothetical protein Glove_15g40 [Diversispora epigaea]